MEVVLSTERDGGGEIFWEMVGTKWIKYFDIGNIICHNATL